MKHLLTFILITLTIAVCGQSKKELQLKIESLEKAKTTLSAELSTSKQELAVLKAEIEYLKRENDLLRKSSVSKQDETTISQPASETNLTESTTETKKCKAITSKGTQCSRNADPGSDYCWQHKKTFEPNSTKESITPEKSTGSSSGNTGSGRVIQTGPRGGRYYINSKGNKVYVK